MKTYRVIFSPEAKSHLTSIHDYIAASSSPQRALQFTEAIVAYCEGLRTSPHRGTRRDDLLSGARVVGFRRRVTIVFEVGERIVTIAGVFYGGRDVEANFRDTDA